MSKPKLRFITSSLESNHEPMLKFVHACKASGFNFVEVPHSLFKETRHLRKMLKYGFDHIFMAKHREKVHLSEDSVRESLSDYLEEVERTMVAIKDKLEILVAENRRDQSKVGAMNASVLKTRDTLALRSNSAPAEGPSQIPE
jgi:hypothetical protein